MATHTYYKEIKTRRGINLQVMYLYEQGFPYELETLKVQGNIDKTFEDWLAMQLKKSSKRLIFDKLLASVDKLVKAKENLCWHLWQINQQAHKLPIDDVARGVTDLVYKQSSIIEQAQTYNMLFASQLTKDDIQYFMDSIDFGEGNMLHYKAQEVIEKIQSIMDQK